MYQNILSAHEILGYPRINKETGETASDYNSKTAKYELSATGIFTLSTRP